MIHQLSSHCHERSYSPKEVFKKSYQLCSNFYHFQWKTSQKNAPFLRQCPGGPPPRINSDTFWKVKNAQIACRGGGVILDNADKKGCFFREVFPKIWCQFSKKFLPSHDFDHCISICIVHNQNLSSRAWHCWLYCGAPLAASLNPFSTSLEAAEVRSPLEWIIRISWWIKSIMRKHVVVMKNICQAGASQSQSADMCHSESTFQPGGKN